MARIFSLFHTSLFDFECSTLFFHFQLFSIFKEIVFITMQELLEN